MIQEHNPDPQVTVRQYLPRLMHPNGRESNISSFPHPEEDTTPFSTRILRTTMTVTTWPSVIGPGHPVLAAPAVHSSVLPPVAMIRFRSGSLPLSQAGRHTKALPPACTRVGMRPLRSAALVQGSS